MPIETAGTTDIGRTLHDLSEDDTYIIEVRALIDRVWHDWNGVTVVPAAGG